MKKVMWLGAIALGVAAINALIGSRKECGCMPECWCKQPGLRHFRWVLPFRHHSVPPEWKQEMESSSPS